jgi:acyl-coenzyme A thioesterase PaaI-like protein
MQSRCYGCGSLNDAGLQIKSHVEGDECVCEWTPQDYHVAGPDIVYGGIIASVIDCHSAATAMSLAAKHEGKEIAADSGPFYLTKSLNIQYLKPTPIGHPLQLRARVVKFQGRGAQVECELYCNGELCAKGDSVFVRPG